MYSQVTKVTAPTCAVRSSGPWNGSHVVLTDSREQNRRDFQLLAIGDVRATTLLYKYRYTQDFTSDIHESRGKW